MISEIDKAYLAGLIDGEGCINIRRGKYRYASGRRRYEHSLAIMIGMTQQEPIVWLARTFGGHVRFEKKRTHHTPHKHWRRMFFWKRTANKAVDILKLSLPYLKAKKQHALLGIEFQTSRCPCPSKLRNLGLPKPELQKRDRYYYQMRNLNSRSGHGKGLTIEEKEIFKQYGLNASVTVTSP